MARCHAVPAPPDHIVLYDLDCGFCIRMVDRLIRQDSDGRMRAAPIQGEEGQRLLGGKVDPELQLRSWHLVLPDGEIVSAGAALPVALRLLPGAQYDAAAGVLDAVPGVTSTAYDFVASNRSFFTRFLVIALAVLVLAGCGSTVQDDSVLRVYLSAPLSGEEVETGRDLADGAALALEQAGGEAAGAAVELVALDEATGGPNAVPWTQATVGANARAAIEDSASIGFIGELETKASSIAIPITNSQGLPLIAPGPIPRNFLSEAGSNDAPDDLQFRGHTAVALQLVGEPVLDPVDPGFVPLFEGEFGRAPGPRAAYGYEAMSLLLASIEDATDPLDRDSVRSALFGTTDRESVLGQYTIDSAGLARIDQTPAEPDQ